MERNTYPTADRLVDIPTAKTVTRMPEKVVSIPAICLAVGFLCRMKVDARRALIGIQARKTPLSEAVVLLIPMVSPMK